MDGTQLRQASEAHQALVVHHIIFQLPKQITATSNEACLACASVQHTYNLSQGSRLNELEGSHRIPFAKKCSASTLTLYS
jgi:hypothetical protein